MRSVTVPSEPLAACDVAVLVCCTAGEAVRLEATADTSRLGLYRFDLPVTAVAVACDRQGAPRLLHLTAARGDPLAAA